MSSSTTIGEPIPSNELHVRIIFESSAADLPYGACCPGSRELFELISSSCEVASTELIRTGCYCVASYVGCEFELGQERFLVAQSNEQRLP